MSDGGLYLKCSIVSIPLLKLKETVRNEGIFGNSNMELLINTMLKIRVIL